jgi:hypothetical protein
MILLNDLRASTFAALWAIRLPMLARGQPLAASSQQKKPSRRMWRKGLSNKYSSRVSALCQDPKQLNN